jgi:hypothetical protein
VALARKGDERRNGRHNIVCYSASGFGAVVPDEIPNFVKVNAGFRV